jgi:hypothetical protein
VGAHQRNIGRSWKEKLHVVFICHQKRNLDRVLPMAEKRRGRLTNGREKEGTTAIQHEFLLYALSLKVTNLLPLKGNVSSN